MVLSAGSAAAPAYTTTGDTNTGMFFPAADTIGFAEGGVESMRIDSSGNVGIGRTNPGERLSVQNTSMTSNTVGSNVVAGFRSNAVNADTCITLTDGQSSSAKFGQNAGALYWMTSESERMRITNGGNVGIGTSSPSYKLQATGGNSTNNNDANVMVVDGTNHARLKINTTSSGGFRSSLILSSNSALSITTNEVAISTTGSQEMQFATAATERMRIDSVGRVMIGTTSNFQTATRLTIVAASSSGPALYTENSTNTLAGQIGATVYVRDTTSSNSPATAGFAGIGFLSGPGVDYVVGKYWSGTGSTFVIKDAAAALGTNLVTVTSAGNVGIGTSSPSTKLSVSGEIRNTSSADASPYTQARLSAYIDASNWGYIGYGADAIMRIVYARTASNYALRFGTTDATDNTGTFTENLRIGDFGIGLKNSSGADGIGITFPATQSASSNANTLDDYEEGTWLPSFGTTGTALTITYNQRAGTYIKVGRMVTVFARIVINTVSGGSGVLTVTGLPFTISTDSDETGGSIGLAINWAANAPTVIQQEGGSTFLFVMRNVSNSNNVPADLGNNVYFNFTCSYFV